MRIQHKKIRKWKTGLIGQANGSEVMYCSFAYVLIRFDTIQKRQIKVHFLCVYVI